MVGVSGGPDSTALLLGCFVLSRRKRRGLSVPPVAVHVHHHLRDSADEDAEFVQELCERFGIAIRIEHVHPAARAGNIAANARELRYEALVRVAREEGAGFIAAAHHADDQFETVLMNLCRGAGLNGLAGMPPSRVIGEGIGEPIRLVRPLLNVSKADCEAFCRDAGVKWRTDPTNARADLARGRLRAQVIPVLEELWPDAAKRLRASTGAISWARELLDAETIRVFGSAQATAWDRERLRAAPAPVLAAGLRRAARGLKPKSADRIDQDMLLAAAAAIVSDDRSPRRFDWPGGLRMRITSRDVRLAVIEADRGPSRSGRSRA